MPPARVEGRVLHAEVTRPGDAPRHIERDDLAIAEPGVDALSVGRRRWRREIVFFVKLGKRSGRFGAVLPEPAAVGSTKGFDDEPHRFASGRISVLRLRLRAPAADRLFAIGERAIVPRELWMLAPDYAMRADL